MENSRFNLEYAKLFIKRAEMDLKSAKVLLDNDIYPDSIYHSQQCIEKAVKAVLVLNDMVIRKHIVSAIFKKVVRKLSDEVWKEKLLNLISKIEKLEEHWVLPRYPEPIGDEIWNPLDNYTKEDAEECLKDAEEVLNVIKEFLKEKYGLE
jgi:HEPN domain-containing protein